MTAAAVRTASPGRRLLLALVVALLLAAMLELLAALAALELRRRGIVPYLPDLPPARIAAWLRQHDPQLGWVAESRTDPLAPSGSTPCASAYGDSYTWGSGVGSAQSWPHQLGRLLGCPVANFGVGGYGSDQALLRFRRHLAAGTEPAPRVILGHVSENLLRNLNRYRNLLYPGSELGFKPRFVLQPDGGLRLLPLPLASAADFERLRLAPDEVLARDAFLDRARLQFPYSLALARFGFGDFHVRTRLAGVPWYAPFYQTGHPAGGVALTTAILAHFDAEARAAGRAPLVVLIPTGLDLKHARRTGRWIDQPLADALAARGVATLQAGPALLAGLQGGDPCSLYEPCNGHFNAEGYRRLAGLVAATLATLPSS